ncbi:uncharacterized protein LOC130408324 isoform X1 [Triplophysa dalaica]|uniref:uncharacterized protein LOC130408324 isoform X1 n=1 Tax=Triplophysa dalaica TaxID=1582913 RepID=UPI0024DF509D|nr:uncharacterized protein LOC130408324 isoform X1 [Triplophysa dalaica]
MCFEFIPVFYRRQRSHPRRKARRTHSQARPIHISPFTPLSLSMGLWNCQSAVNKTDFIDAFASQSEIHILGLTETWIRPEDSATPAALSTNYSFSHTPRQTGRGGGTGLLITNDWKYSTLSSLCNNYSFEYHAVNITFPTQLSVVVVYRPSGPLHDFIEELDVLLSSFPEDSGPLVVLGDFNIHLEKPYAADFHTLTASFDLTRLVTASTHRSDRLVPLPAAPGCLTSSVNNVVHSGLLKGNGARPRTLLT